jgi:hypothetical protein
VILLSFITSFVERNKLPFFFGTMRAVFECDLPLFHQLLGYYIRGILVRVTDLNVEHGREDFFQLITGNNKLVYVLK